MCDKKIIIIGAGLSGISAGVKLMENNFTNLVILEAEGRIGGRIHSVEFGGNGKKIDLGGQWTDDQQGNVIYEMAKDHVEFQPSVITPDFFLSNGSLVNQDDSMKLLMLSLKILQCDEMKDFNGSLGDFINEKYTEALNSSDYSDIDTQLAAQFKEYFLLQVKDLFAAKSSFDVSRKLSIDFKWIPFVQSVAWNDKGFITIIDYITVWK